MTTYVLILFASLVLVIGVTPLAQRVARRVGMVDKPSARKQHTVPTPLLGGAAIFVAVILALLLLGDRFYVNQVAGIALGATLVSSLGLWDDRRGLSPWVKLAGQFLAAGVLVITDVRISVFPWPWVNIAATLVWVVFITNAMNLLDNMDGLERGWRPSQRSSSCSLRPSASNTWWARWPRRWWARASGSCSTI